MLNTTCSVLGDDDDDDDDGDDDDGDDGDGGDREKESMERSDLLAQGEGNKGKEGFRWWWW